MNVKAITTAPEYTLVVPLGQQRSTDMRTMDTAAQPDLFEQAVSRAVSLPIDLHHDLRPGDVDSTNDRRTPVTPTTPGCRTSATATRTTTTSRTTTGCVSSAACSAAPPADFSFALLVQAYLDCRRAKRNTPSARAFELHQERELSTLYTDLAAGTWTPGPSTCFVITRPKPREVWAAPFRDRIVHHLLYNRVGAAIERTFISDSCACIPGRGTGYAAERLESKVRSITQNWSRPAWYLKLDLANFFVSIHKPTLRDQLAARIRDPWWLALALQILLHNPRPEATVHGTSRLLARVPPHKRLGEQSPDRGLPIGNLSSQFFANVYLDALDQHVKHGLRCRHYVRYVDDFILLHESPQQLNAWLDDLTAFLFERLGVHINPAKTVLQPVERGIDFVGHLIKPWCRRTRPRTVRAALQRIERIPSADLHVSANSTFGLLRQATHSHGDRARLARLVRRRGLAVDMKLTKSYP